MARYGRDGSKLFFCRRYHPDENRRNARPPPSLFFVCWFVFLHLFALGIFLPPPPPNDGSWNGGRDGSVGSGSSGIIDFAIAFRPVVGFSMFVFGLNMWMWLGYMKRVLIDRLQGWCLTS